MVIEDVAPPIVETAGNFGINVVGGAKLLWTIVPIIIIIIVFAIAIWFFIYIKKFKYPTHVYSLRAKNEIVHDFDTKGGFINNWWTKQEQFMILKERKAYIYPFPNKYIQVNKTTGKDFIDLIRISGGVYLPLVQREATIKLKKPIITYAEREGKDGKMVKEAVKVEYEEPKEFIYDEDYAMQWLENRRIHHKQKYALLNFLDKYGQFISMGIILIIFFLGMYFTVDAVKFGLSLAASKATQSVSILLLIPVKKLFKE